MGDVVITAERLGKQFRRGASAPYLRASEQLQSAMRAARSLGRRRSRARNRDETNSLFWAVRDASFSISEGEVVGLVGRNGAGKSTLLKLLARITEPTEGRFGLRGRVGSLLEVGTGFHAELTGRENIFLNGAILGMSRREVARKFDEIVAFAEVADFIDTPVKRYSSGMSVRLAFAVAAHLEPEILLVDEVLAVGDVAFQNKCLNRIGEVARGGRTVLFVSHSMAAVQRLCTRALLVDRGQVRACATVDEAIQSYLARGGETTLRWERQPPYPDHPHLRRAFLCDGDARPTDTPDSAARFGVMIEYEQTRPVTGGILALAVLNAAGQPLFSTAAQDAGQALPSAPGSYATRLLFPAALFMPGRYVLTVSYYSVAENFDSVPQMLEFDVAEAASLANSLPGGRWGHLQIHCDWTAPAVISPTPVTRGS